MRSFHMSCPYTSLLVCQCNLQVSKPRPIITKTRKHNNPLRQALLNQLVHQTASSHNLNPTFIRNIYFRGNYGHLPPSTNTTTTNQQLLSTFVRHQDLDRESRLHTITLRHIQAKSALEKTKQQLQRAQQKATFNSHDQASRRIAADLVHTLPKRHHHDEEQPLPEHSSSDNHPHLNHQLMSSSSDEPDDDTDESDDDPNDPDDEVLALISSRGRSASTTTRRRRTSGTSRGRGSRGRGRGRR